ncbi:MAG: hypothetical protein Ct9H300mP3_11780 [Gammaproteobacteria bacterium]|nr:MAG: hypothetical protein Ct9H300mP3_11780 [Gammaproteobacteria bacterium]
MIKNQIVDPHHHLWPGTPRTDGVSADNRYLFEDLWNDTESGKGSQDGFCRVWSGLL